MPVHAYDLQLRYRERDRGSRITRTLDLADDAGTDVMLRGLLLGSIQRTDGDMRDVDRYDLQIYETGGRRPIRTYAIHRGEVPP